MKLSLWMLVGLAISAGSQISVAQEAAQKDKEAKPTKKTRQLPPPKAADADAPLPEGWPGGTAPGKIEIKKYPAYRSAVAKAKNTSQSSDGVLFFSLFNHISRKGVEMTAPVVNTYSDEKMVENPRAMGDMTMEFLYASTKQGETGRGVGAVNVVDHPAQTFVCIGIQGEMEAEAMSTSLSALRGWLEEHKAEWVADGQPRRLGYHGPMTPSNRRLWELQIPVKPAKAK